MHIVRVQNVNAVDIYLRKRVDAMKKNKLHIRGKHIGACVKLPRECHITAGKVGRDVLILAVIRVGYRTLLNKNLIYRTGNSARICVVPVIHCPVVIQVYYHCFLRNCQIYQLIMGAVRLQALYPPESFSAY